MSINSTESDQIAAAASHHYSVGVVDEAVATSVSKIPPSVAEN